MKRWTLEELEEIAGYVVKRAKQRFLSKFYDVVQYDVEIIKSELPWNAWVIVRDKKTGKEVKRDFVTGLYMELLSEVKKALDLFEDMTGIEIHRTETYQKISRELSEAEQCWREMTS